MARLRALVMEWAVCLAIGAVITVVATTAALLVPSRAHTTTCVLDRGPRSWIVAIHKDWKESFVQLIGFEHRADADAAMGRAAGAAPGEVAQSPPDVPGWVLNEIDRIPAQRGVITTGAIIGVGWPMISFRVRPDLTSVVPTFNGFLTAGPLNVPYVPLWPRFLASAAIFAPIPYALRRVLLSRRHARRQRCNTCTTCEYDRSALPPDAPCPECGASPPAITSEPRAN